MAMFVVRLTVMKKNTLVFVSSISAILGTGFVIVGAIGTSCQFLGLAVVAGLVAIASNIASAYIASLRRTTFKNGPPSSGGSGITLGSAGGQSGSPASAKHQSVA